MVVKFRTSGICIGSECRISPSDPTRPRLRPSAVPQNWGNRYIGEGGPLSPLVQPASPPKGALFGVPRGPPWAPHFGGAQLTSKWPKGRSIRGFLGLLSSRGPKMAKWQNGQNGPPGVLKGVLGVLPGRGSQKGVFWGVPPWDPLLPFFPWGGVLWPLLPFY